MITNLFYRDCISLHHFVPREHILVIHLNVYTEQLSLLLLVFYLQYYRSEILKLYNYQKDDLYVFHECSK